MVEKLCGIYKIQCTINKKVYIGQSGDIKTRFRTHKNKLRKNKHDNQYLQNAYIKYGEESFKYEIIEVCNKELLDVKEIYWINFYNSLDEYFGYNMQSGGHKNKNLAESTKKLMSEQRRGEKHPNFGKHLSEETRNKISESHQGKILSEKHKQKLKGRKSSFLGRHHTEESKRKLSEARKGKKGHSNSEEARRKNSISQKKNRKKVKLTDEQVIEIRQKYTTGKYSLHKLSKEYPVSRETIKSVVSFRGAYDENYDPYKNLKEEGENM